MRGFPCVFIRSLSNIVDGIKYEEMPSPVDVRRGICGIHGVAYDAHNIMGVHADNDMDKFLDEAMTRFIKNDADKDATIAMHAAKGVKEIYFTGSYPTMLMKSAVDQPDAPKDRILNSASFKPANYSPILDSIALQCRTS